MYYIMRKSYYVMHKLLRYAKNVLRYAVIITLCGNYYVMWRQTRVILVWGNVRLIFCSDDYLSASFASLHAFGQLIERFLFIVVIPHETRSSPKQSLLESHPARATIMLLSSILDCCMLSVWYMFRMMSTLTTVSNGEVTNGVTICWAFS